MPGQRLNFTFEADDVDERTCAIENLPRTVVAGEQFAIQIRVRPRPRALHI